MRRLSVFLAVLCLAAPAFAQKKQVTLSGIYDPAEKVAFSGAIQSGFDWIDDATFIWPKRNEKAELVEWRLFDAATGKSRTFIDKAKLQKALEAAGLPEDEAKEAAAKWKQTFDANHGAVVLSAGDELFVYSIAKNTATRLTSTPGEEQDAAFSPDGQKVAFTRDHDLFVIDLQGRDRQLTTDGSGKLLNGRFDWVYQEEIYGRGTFRAFWWSPDSARLAFLQTDDRPVHEFTVVDHIGTRQDVELTAYPEPGDPNPKVKLFITPVAGGRRTEVDLERYTGGEFLIVNVAWNGDGSALMYQVQDREQRWLDLDASDVKGKSRTLFRETTQAWVDPIGNPVWLADGSFLWRSERSGWQHLYHYQADGTLIRQLTNGEWEARDLIGADEKSGYVYFSGTERSPIGSDVYRIKLDGTGLERLSQEPGTHSATFNPSMTLYVDKWSDVRTPDRIRLYKSDGKVAYVVDENRNPLGDYDLLPAEFLQVNTKDGFAMEAMMVKPRNFDPSKKYPVYWHLYGGPHSQTVRNAWRSANGMFGQLLASQGVLVFQCDNRSASGKGAVSAWHAYKRLGESELADLEDAVTWLKAQPYVDGNRIMLNGWSYGGFMVSYALTHSKSFAAGIAGGSVTDWRLYDSVYTERFMLMPQNNPDGYKRTAPRLAAKDLHGKLLLLHGTIDDNVHMQNTIQFVWELQKAGKPFDMMVYPKSRHGVINPALQFHMQQTMLEFIRKSLGL